MHRLLDFCAMNKQDPTCPSCRAEFLLDDFLIAEISQNTVSQQLYHKYISQTCERVRARESQAHIEKMNQVKLIEKIREEKQTFIAKTFPLAISLVINIAMKNELQRIDRRKRQEILNIRKGTQNCFILTCNGKIDIASNTCTRCQKRFCDKCEKEKIQGIYYTIYLD
jgi:predicted nucleic acid binding AN1-type Zn finger protein